MEIVDFATLQCEIIVFEGRGPPVLRRFATHFSELLWGHLFVMLLVDFGGPRGSILEARGCPETSRDALGVPFGNRVRFSMIFGGFWDAFGTSWRSPWGTFWALFQCFSAHVLEPSKVI